MKHIIIATGGTGGHIIPARVLAKNLQQRGLKVAVLADVKYKSYIRKDDDFESKIIQSSQIVKKPLALASAAIKIFIGFWQTLLFFIKFRPDFVVAFGGYATFPILVASIITRRKIILHEQNAHLGKVNRLFAPFSHQIALTFAQTSGIDENLRQKLVVCGNPVRPEIASLHDCDYNFPKAAVPKIHDKMGYNVILASEIDDFLSDSAEDESFNVLVIGGSGGAKIFSDILPRAFFNLGENLKNILHISQQCRKDLVVETFERYRKFNISIEVSHFFEDMAEKIKAAHLIVARAGSSSIVEFCAAKKPMILVPFKCAADDHQLKNARIVESAGAAIVVLEDEFNITKMSEIVRNLVNNKNILKKMSQNASIISNISAADNLAKLVDK